MYPRLDGELLKVMKLENGFNVVVWDPEPPPTVLPGQAPCAQQPMKWWRHYTFKTSNEVTVFITTFMESVNG